MRKRVTFAADTVVLIRERMHQTGQTFEETVNDAIRSGLTAQGSVHVPPSLPTFAMGVPSVDLDRTLSLAGELEDEELLRRSSPTSHLE